MTSQSRYYDPRDFPNFSSLLASREVILDQGTPDDATDDTRSRVAYNYYNPTTTGGEWRVGEIERAIVVSEAPGTDGVEKATWFEYYPSGHASVGMLSQETLWKGAPNELTQEHSYDAFGNAVKTITRSPGMPTVETSAFFDGAFPSWTKNALGHRVSTSYDESLSVITGTSDPYSGYTGVVYDRWGTPKITTNPNGLRSVRFTQSFQDTSLPKCLYYIYEQTEGGPPVITYYDRYHRALLVEKIGFNGETIFQESRSELIFNAAGQKIGSRKLNSLPYLAGAETPSYAVEEYDIYDRKIRVIAPDGSTTQVTYNGFRTTVTNHQNQTQQRLMDQRGLLRESIDHAGHRLVYGYTADGLPSAVTTHYAGNNSPSTTIATKYDANRLPYEVSDPNTGTSYTDYDNYGRVKYERRKLGASDIYTVFKYDLLGRTTHQWNGVTSYNSFSAALPSVFETLTVTTFDTAANGLGKPSTITLTHRDGAATRTVAESYAYDSLKRVTSRSVTLSGQIAFNGTYTNSVTYHANTAPGYGRIETLTDAGGYKRASVYNALGFLCQVNEVRGLPDVSQASAADQTDRMLWRGMAYDVQGKPLMEFDGNGIGTKNRYHPTRGFVESSQTYRWTNNQPIQDLDLNMDDLGNVSWRRLTAYVSDGSTAPLTEPEVKTEAFNFDNLNRLTQCYVANRSEQSMAYQDNGNIAAKDGLSYVYAERGHGPHAVTSVSKEGVVQRSYSYDSRGRMTQEHLGADLTGLPLREIAYTSFDQPRYIQHWGAAALSSDLDTLDDGATVWNQVCSIHFYFGPGLQRLIQKKVKGKLVTTSLSLGGYEIREVNDLIGTRIEREERSRFGNGVRVQRWMGQNTAAQTRYEFAAQDHLGSDSVTFESAPDPHDAANLQQGQVQSQRGHLKPGETQKTERQSYDAWGARRDGETWAPAEGPLGQVVPNSLPERIGSNVPRGYTGHEMLDDVGLVHMNGRLYDPVLGRMCAADPVVQSPENAQNHNRYSYVLNNPLSATDPTGWYAQPTSNMTVDILGYGPDPFQQTYDQIAMSQAWQQQNRATQAMQFMNRAASMSYTLTAVPQVRPPLLNAGAPLVADLGGMGSSNSYSIESGYMSVELGFEANEAAAGQFETVEATFIGDEIHADPHGDTGGWSDWIHGGLDVVGLVPGLGEIADGANALYYLYEGNKTEAAIAAAAMIPFLGWGAAATKAARHVAKHADEVAAIAKTTSSAARGVSNPVPSTMARVVDARFVNSPGLGGPGAADVFVTAASDIRGITTSQGLANRLTLLDNAGNLRQGPFGVIEFSTPASGVASPVFRNNPGFLQGGLTGGGAREFVLSNIPVNQLQNVNKRIIP